MNIEGIEVICESTDVVEYAEFVATAFCEVNRVFFDNELPALEIHLGDYRRSNGTNLLGVYLYPNQDDRFPCHTMILNPKAHEPLCGYDDDCPFGSVYEGILDTMVHELVHCWCHLNGIQDCNPNSDYHNENFRDAARTHGLECELGANGWSATGLGLEACVTIQFESEVLAELLDVL